MPPLTNMRDRGNRLKAFVVHEKPIGHAEEQEDTPYDNNYEYGSNETTPTKQLVAEAARMPVPQPARQRRDPILDDNDTIQANFDEPIHRGRQLSPQVDRAEQPRRIEQLMVGSELGDSFLRSGRSTPSVEREHYNRPEYEEVEEEEVYQQPPPKRYAPKASANAPAAFQLGEDLFMSVVTKTQQRYPREMKDGFSKSAIEGRRQYDREASKQQFNPSNKPQVLPLREVKIHRHRQHAGELALASSRNRHLLAYREDMSTGDSESVVSEDTSDSVQNTPRRRHTRSPERRPLGQGANPPPPSPTKRVPMPSEKKRRRHSLDYEDNVLHEMSFEELRNQSFDVNPQAASAQNGSINSAATLEQRLARFENHGQYEQRKFFTGINIDEWEACGDWFVDRFGDIMKRMRDARRAKRQMIRQFEDEVAHREEAVRHRSEVIDEKLKTMKENGRRVVGEQIMG